VDIARQENQQDAPEKENNGNSAQARKDQKRREAEFRSQTQPLRKQIARSSNTQMEKLTAELAALEETSGRLGDVRHQPQGRTDSLPATADKVRPSPHWKTPK
jgi:Skp family chaperone for outer membrane proteins